MKKAIVMGKRNFARLVANLDGKYQGITQAEAEKAFSLAMVLDVAARVTGYKSPLEMIKKKSIEKAKKFKAKQALVKKLKAWK